MSKKHTLNVVRITRGKAAGQYRWNITARNGEIVAQGESYHRHGALLTTLRNLFAGADHRHGALLTTLRNLFAGAEIAQQVEAWAETLKIRK